MYQFDIIGIQHSNETKKFELSKGRLQAKMQLPASMQCVFGFQYSAWDTRSWIADYADERGFCSSPPAVNETTSCEYVL